jgi:hypothetical protein
LQKGFFAFKKLQKLFAPVVGFGRGLEILGIKSYGKRIFIENGSNQIGAENGGCHAQAADTFRAFLYPANGR